MLGRMTKRRGWLLGAAFAGMFFVGTAWGGEETIKVGFVVDLTGVSKSYSENMALVLRLKVEEINAKGGVLGKKIVLIERNGTNVPEEYAKQMRDLLTKEKVVAVLGGASTPCVLKGSAVCKEFRVPFLVSIGNSSSIVVEQGHPYVFLFQPSSWMETKSFSIFITLMPWKRYAWIGPDYSWGREIYSNLCSHFENVGTSVEWTKKVWHPLEEKDFDPAVKEILDAKPEALIVATYGEDLKRFLIAGNKQHLFDKVAVYGWFTYDIAGSMGKSVPEGMWSMSRGGPFNYLAAKYPEAKEFVDTFHKKHNVYPIGFSVCAYDSLVAVKTVLEKTKSTDPIKIAEGLKGLKFSGMRGEHYIRPIDGQMDCSTYFGRLVYEKQYPFAVWTAVREIPAERTWMSEKEVLAQRAKSKSK